MRRTLTVILVIGVFLLGACSTPQVTPPVEEPMPAIPEPVPPPEPMPPERPEPNMKIVAAELSWAEKYMEDFVFKYHIITDKTDLTEYERPFYYKWGYTDDDFPVQALRVHGGQKYYFLIFMPAFNIAEAKTYIRDDMYSVDIGLMPSKLVDAEEALYRQIALSRDAQGWYEAWVLRTDETGVPSVHSIAEFFEEYRGELKSIIFKLEAAEAELK